MGGGDTKRREGAREVGRRGAGGGGDHRQLKDSYSPLKLNTAMWKSYQNSINRISGTVLRSLFGKYRDSGFSKFSSSIEA